MTRRRAALVILCLLAGVGVAGVVLYPRLRANQAMAAQYTCPMHPSYTSDRPGACPICNMKLVKREPSPPAAAPSAHEHAGHNEPAKPLAAICYLHNCPKLHQGQPCPMMVVAKPGEAVTCPICGTDVAEASSLPAARKILYWTDPMIPGYKADGPGRSPMGMDLVPVYEEAQGSADIMAATPPSGYAPVLLTSQRQQLIGVKTAPATRRRLAKTIRTVGRIAYDPELYQAQQEYLQALRAAERAERGTIPEVKTQGRQLVESSRIRLRLLGMSDALIDEMRSWEGPDQSLLLADPEQHVWVYATIYEYELPLVKVGQTILAELPAVPGKVLEGTIQAIDPVLDPKTRSARVRAVLADSDGALKPEMYVNASIRIDAGELLAVPQEAIFSTGEQELVFVDRGQGLFEPRDVVIGIRAEGYAQIQSGVTEGERVVTSGNFLIDSESRLKGALDGMSGGSHQHGP